MELLFKLIVFVVVIEDGVGVVVIDVVHVISKECIFGG